MDFQNLSITRVIIHRVFKRQADRQIVTPVYGSALAQLAAEEISALQDRILAALGSGANSMQMQMQIVSCGQGSALHLARQLVDHDEPLFVSESQQMATLLAHSQGSVNIPGGILVVFAGTANYPPKRIIGAIKAEPHAGFSFADTNGILRSPISAISSSHLRHDSTRSAPSLRSTSRSRPTGLRTAGRRTSTTT
jgi:hypothetical protein